MDSILLEVDGACATLVLNRPARANAMDRPMAEALCKALDDVAARPEVAVLVLRGAGRNFCAGGDLQAVAERPDAAPETIRDSLPILNEAVLKLHALPAISIASLHGSVAGAGLSFALMADLCIAARDTRFRPAYAGLGISPDMGGSVAVSRVLGPRRAFALLALEDELDAARMAELGFVDRIAAPEALEAGTAAMVARLLSIPKEALLSTRALVRSAPGRDLREQLDDECDRLARLVGQPAYREALRGALRR